MDNILSNNGTDDHCVEFVRLGGLEPLYNLLNMANFPLEFPLMPACQSIAQVCKSIAVSSFLTFRKESCFLFFQFLPWFIFAGKIISKGPFWRYKQINAIFDSTDVENVYIMWYLDMKIGVSWTCSGVTTFGKNEFLLLRGFISLVNY